MKTIWNGSLAFGLVHIPVKLYSAIRSHTIGFRLLHATCNTPISYERWCSHCKKEITWENIVKGLEQPDGSYIVFTKEQLRKLRPQKTEALSILFFTNKDQIKDIYIDQHYYLVPDKNGAKPFFLFLEALEKTNKVAIGQFVMHDKQYICSIHPSEGTLLLNTLNYAYEIVPIKNIPLLTKTKATAQEVKLAQNLIAQLTKKTFRIDQFKDTFAEELKKTITAKNRKKTKPIAIAKKSPKTKEKNLISILQASLKAPSRGSVSKPAYAKRR